MKKSLFFELFDFFDLVLLCACNGLIIETDYFLLEADNLFNTKQLLLSFIFSHSHFMSHGFGESL